jgi:ribose transport system permease protein
MKVDAAEVGVSQPTVVDDLPPMPQRRPRWKEFGLDRYSGLWVIGVLIAFYWIWEPSTFGTWNNVRVIASSQAITGVLTMGLIVSLICGVFDLSVAGNMSLALILVAWFQSHYGLNPFVAVGLTLLIGGLIGVANAFIVTKLHVDAVIGTLGMSSILAAMAFWVSTGQDIVSGISPAFISFGTAKPLTIPIGVYFLAAVSLLVWYLLEHTPTGRYFYAVGFNAEACRLAGVRVVRLQWLGLITSGVLASGAGIMLTLQLGSASFGAGNAYLLPAFSAAFLGSTQIKPGKFNVGGTLVALYLLAIGVQGLQLKYPSQSWIPDLFDGLALIIAVALARRTSRSRGKVNPA